MDYLAELYRDVFPYEPPVWRDVHAVRIAHDPKTPELFNRLSSRGLADEDIWWTISQVLEIPKHWRPRSDGKGPLRTGTHPLAEEIKKLAIRLANDNTLERLTVLDSNVIAEFYLRAVDLPNVEKERVTKTPLPNVSADIVDMRPIDKRHTLEAKAFGNTMRPGYLNSVAFCVPTLIEYLHALAQVLEHGAWMNQANASRHVPMERNAAQSVTGSDLDMASFVALRTYDVLHREGDYAVELDKPNGRAEGMFIYESAMLTNIVLGLTGQNEMTVARLAQLRKQSHGAILGRLNLARSPDASFWR